jgi:hypothetical protein
MRGVAPELHVLEAKRMGIASWLQILAWAEKKKESEPHEIK